MARTPVIPWTGSSGDRTRERTVMLHQLLLGFVSLVALLVALGMGAILDLHLALIAMLLIVVLTGAAIGVPWNRVPALWSALLPLGDIVAITLMRQSNPGAGFSMLWIFPAMWIAGAFGLVGLLVAVLFTNGLYIFTAVVDPRQDIGPVIFLIPMLIVAVSVTSFMAARRAAAQRALLAAQARLLTRALDRARRQEDLVTEVLDAVDFGVVRFGQADDVFVRNEAHARMQRMLAVDEREHRVFADDGLTELAPDALPLSRAQRGETFERELVWYGAPGTGRRALSMTSRTLGAEDGENPGGILISRDVTDEVMALRARDDLVASVSHELRTPLTSILGYLELALDSEDVPPRVRRGLEVAERNAERLLDIIGDLLAVASDANGGIQLSIAPQRVEVDRTVLAAVEAVTARAAERGISIDTNGVEPTTVEADPLRLRQVLDNLVGNAVKYNHDAGLIEIGVTADGDHAWIVVRDHGPGIAADELPRLFERFFRADAVRRTSTHGSGLGLSISRDIIRAHGGEITVSSQLGDGATFVVRLPMYGKAT